jgi:hypothetical protein
MRCTTTAVQLIFFLQFEKRKGWDILLQAYFEEFSSSDNVALYILTSEYHAKEGEKPRQLIQNASDKAAGFVLFWYRVC